METNTFTFVISEQQKAIVEYDAGCVVARACPGSGKTFSVAARIARLLREKDFSKFGIAAMSFTNVAGEEISHKLSRSFGIHTPLGFPHFIGTIDSFINTYVFLPFGHLIMGCNSRPQLVGQPHRSWTKGKGDKKFVRVKGQQKCVSANPDCYFDCTSFDINDLLYPIVAAQEIHFSLKPDKYYNANGRVNKRVQDVIDSKFKNYRMGYANQADANYISMKVLAKYPLIARAIANKFQYFIIDEAQDTDAIQMRIIEILNVAGAKNIMLIGDRDQAIYEWNNADPSLFDSKYAQWNKIELTENWRSSQRICDFTLPLSSFPRVRAARDEVSNFDYQPVVKGYVKNDTASMIPILQEFFATCEQNIVPVNLSNVAVLFRGKTMRKYLGSNLTGIEFGIVPWLKNQYHVRDILFGKVLFERGDARKGYQLVEKGYYDAAFKLSDPHYHCSATLVQKYVDEKGFMVQRTEVTAFLKLLPSTKGQRIGSWIQEVNLRITATSLKFRLAIDHKHRNLLVSEIFSREADDLDKLPFYNGTVHSVKGRTFEAVLLMLDKKAGTHSNYISILRNGPRVGEEEELRTVYVGLTRPTKILMLAVPKEDVGQWIVKLS
ncbi:UvrD-helicase domain-containing protein [Dyadobacter sp. CY343]|uniref:UvrD-helicase domain-containing protein n=1 Tax=Dyadobacter sp. CY343 TaxID=2907299 RepID=UPI001F399222|nr:ATP-dependent helicase [Dyadobacter sp. CY343]MCE7061935.1 ATP-dependent helicase [Dyadobacter sp. CY343]